MRIVGHSSNSLQITSQIDVEAEQSARTARPIARRDARSVAISWWALSDPEILVKCDEYLLGKRLRPARLAIELQFGHRQLERRFELLERFPHMFAKVRRF